MSNDFEIRERMGSYRGVLLVLVWILAGIGGITGIKLITVVNEYVYQYYDFYGIVLIVTSIVGGIVGHLLVTVVFEIVFMLTEIKEQQRHIVINTNTSPASGSSANHEEKFAAKGANPAPPLTGSAAKLAERLVALDTNTAKTPYTVTIEPCNISDNWGDINTAVQFAGKYIILDLSTCSVMENTIRGNREPTGNDFNIIKGNKYIKGIILPESLISIGDYAFYGCKNLSSVTIPSSVTNIGREAFNNCGGLISVVIPEGVTSIGDFAFYGFISLTSVIFSTGSDISKDNFGNGVFPEGHYANGGNRLKKAYGTGKAGTYTRAVDGSIWTKQE